MRLDTPDRPSPPSQRYLATSVSTPGADYEDTRVLVDRLSVKPGTRTRLVRSIEVCHQRGHGQAMIEAAGQSRLRLQFSEGFERKRCALRYATPEPQLFS